MVKVGSRWRCKFANDLVEVVKLSGDYVYYKYEKFPGTVLWRRIDVFPNSFETVDSDVEPADDDLETFTIEIPDPPLSDEARARYDGFVSADGKRVDVAAWRRAVG